MLALEIRVNGGEPVVVGADILMVQLRRFEARNQHSLLAFGADDLYRYKWLDKDMQDGDKVSIRVVEVDKDQILPSPQTEKCDLERNKRLYEELKHELQDKLLI